MNGKGSFMKSNGSKDKGEESMHAPRQQDDNDVAEGSLRKGRTVPMSGHTSGVKMHFHFNCAQCLKYSGTSASKTPTGSAKATPTEDGLRSHE